MLQRLRELAGLVAAHTDATDEHQAVVELLVLTAYADHRISHQERRSLEAFETAHGGWDEGAFSVAQYLPAAFSKVRTALEQPTGVDGLLADIAARITTPAARTEALEACRSLARTDGTVADEVAYLAKVKAALSGTAQRG